MFFSNLIYVKYLGPTNHRGNRIQLSTYDLQYKKNIRKTFNRDYSINAYDQIELILKNAGLNVLGMNNRNEKYDIYMIQCDFDKINKLFK